MLIGNSELLIVNLSNSKLRHLQYFDDWINILTNFEIANIKHAIYPGDFTLRSKAALKAKGGIPLTLNNRFVNLSK